MNREKMVAEIKRLEREYRTAGEIHKKDIYKRLNRLRKELRTYDGYMALWKARREAMCDMHGA